MKFLTRDEILSAKDLPYKDVEVKEWGGWVRIRTLRGVDRAQLVAALQTDPDKEAPTDWIERMLVACITDNKGNKLFDETDIKNLGEKNSGIIQKLFDVADNLNAITGKSMESLKGE